MTQSVSRDVQADRGAAEHCLHGYEFSSSPENTRRAVPTDAERVGTSSPFLVEPVCLALLTDPLVRVHGRRVAHRPEDERGHPSGQWRHRGRAVKNWCRRARRRRRATHFRGGKGRTYESRTIRAGSGQYSERSRICPTPEESRETDARTDEHVRSIQHMHCCCGVARNPFDVRSRVYEQYRRRSRGAWCERRHATRTDRRLWWIDSGIGRCTGWW